MLAVSNAFNEAFKQNYRDIKMRIKINDVTYTDSDIISFNYNAGSIVGESFAIGSTFANTIKLTLCKIVEGLKQLDEVIPEMGIVLPNGGTEFVKLGTFIISEQVNPDRNENRTSIECTDKMIMLDDPYESKLKYPNTIRSVALEIANLAGVEVDKTSFSRITESKIQKPVGYTYRQALGLIAQFEAGYAKFDRNGLLAIERLVDKNYEVTPNEYFQKGLVKNELLFRPSGIQVRTSDDNEKLVSVGNSKGSVINLENKVMTKNLLDDMYIKVKDINYYPYSLNWRGNPAVEVGDWLRVTDLKGNQFKVPNLSYSLEYKGGLTATSTVETVASNEVRFGYKKILDQVIEHVDNVLEGAGGNDIYYGTEQPPYPKEGDVWFKKVGPDTEIWVYEKIGEPDIFDWVKKISTAMDETLKEKIEDLEKISKENTEKVDQALLEAEKSREEAELARQEAFDSTTIARQAELDALNALALGDGNRTEIKNLEGEQKLTNTKVEGNTVKINSLQNDSDGMKLSLGKVQSDVENINVGDGNDFPESEKERDAQKITGREFLNVVAWDMAPLIDEYGTDREYTLSVDIKAPIPGKVRVYSQNGSSTRYSIGQHDVDVTTEYQRFYFVFKPTKSNMNDPRATLAFFGAYGTGVFPIVRKAMFTIGNVRKEWQISERDLTSKSEFATLEANYQGFQTDVKSDLTGLHSQQTQMSGQISSVVEKVDNLNISNRNYVLDSKQSVKSTEYKIKSYKTSELWEVGKKYTVIIKGKTNPGNYFGIWRDLGNQILLETKYNKELDLFIGSAVCPPPFSEATNFNWLTVFNRGSQRPYDAEIEWVMLIKGEMIVSDWSPAPEDNASKTEVTQLSNQWAVTAQEVKTIDGIVSKQQASIAVLTSQIDLKVNVDEVISRINLSPEQILIKSKLIHLSGQSLIDDAVITKAMIKDVSADSMTVGTLNGANVNIINLNAGNITSGFLNANRIRARTIRADHLQADAIELALNEMGRSVKLSPVDLKVMNGHLEFMKMDLEGLQVARLDGNRLGTIGRGHKPGYPEIEGLTFSLEHRGQFMSWTSRENINDNYYTDRMILDPKGGYTGVSGLHLETRLRAKQGGTITGGDWQWYVDMNLNKHTIAQPRLANGFIAEDFYFEKGNSLQSYRNIHMNGYNVTGSSSYSLKENFEYMSELDSLNAILVTDIVGYNYIENPDTFNIGFVIDDNGQSPYYTDPRLIRSKKYRDDSLLVGHLMLGIKALNEKITLLEERVYER